MYAIIVFIYFSFRKIYKLSFFCVIKYISINENSLSEIFTKLDSKETRTFLYLSQYAMLRILVIDHHLGHSNNWLEFISKLDLKEVEIV